MAGLRSQEFELNPEQLKLEDGQVVFPYEVGSYDMLSNFIRKAYVGQFGPAFSFAQIQTFLRPTSPLHRLVLPVPVPVHTSLPAKKPATR